MRGWLSPGLAFELHKVLSFERKMIFNRDSQRRGFAPTAVARRNGTEFPGPCRVAAEIMKAEHETHVEGWAMADIPKCAAERDHAEAWQRLVGIHGQQRASTHSWIDARVWRQHANWLERILMMPFTVPPFGAPLTDDHKGGDRHRDGADRRHSIAETLEHFEIGHVSL